MADNTGAQTHILSTDDFLAFPQRPDALEDQDLEDSVIFCHGARAKWTLGEKEFANSAVRSILRDSDAAVTSWNSLTEGQRRHWVQTELLPKKAEVHAQVMAGEEDHSSLISQATESLALFVSTIQSFIPMLASGADGPPAGADSGTDDLRDIHKSGRTIHHCLSQLTKIHNLPENTDLTDEQKKLKEEVIDGTWMHLIKLERRIEELSNKVENGHWDGKLNHTELTSRAVRGEFQSLLADTLVDDMSHDRLVTSGYAKSLLKLQKCWAELLRESTDLERTKSTLQEMKTLTEGLKEIHLDTMCDSLGLDRNQRQEAAVDVQERFVSTLVFDDRGGNNAYTAATKTLPYGQGVDHYTASVDLDLAAIESLQ